MSLLIHIITHRWCQSIYKPKQLVILCFSHHNYSNERNRNMMYVEIKKIHWIWIPRMYIQFGTNCCLVHCLQLFNSGYFTWATKCYLICCNRNELRLGKHERGCGTPRQGHYIWRFDYMDTGDILVHRCQNHLQKRTIPLYNLCCSDIWTVSSIQCYIKLL
jgi:hypothetical protein